MKVGIMGASGYVGGELLRLIINHPEAELSFATSRQYDGQFLYKIHPNLKGFTDVKFSLFDSSKVSDQCDLLFTAAPHGSSYDFMKELVDSGVKIVDMSADYRLSNPDMYDKWYGYKHPLPDLLDSFTFGLPELHRDSIKSSKLTSTPGCTALTSILALSPLIQDKLIDPSNIIIDSKVGSSGAGVKPTAGSHHANRYGVIRPFKPYAHRHTAEIDQELTNLSDTSINVSLSVHSVNLVRGILCTSYASINSDIGEVDVWKSFRQFYSDSPFVRLIADKKGLYKYPDPKLLVGSNFCDIGFAYDKSASRLVIMSSSDNLIKGAAGTAVQNMNLMSGFDETSGLWTPGIHPM